MLKFDQNTNPKLDFRIARKKPIPIKCAQIHEAFEVETLEGIMKGKAGDWLLIGVKGEKYLCDDAIFRESYDLVES